MSAVKRLVSVLKKRRQKQVSFSKNVWKKVFVSMNEKGGGKKSSTPTPQQFTHQEEHIENSPWKEKVEKP